MKATTLLTVLLLISSIVFGQNKKVKTGNARKSDTTTVTTITATADTAKGSEENNQENLPDAVTFLNAYNFDFNGHLQSNYLGQFNVFKSYKNWGINIGVMKISYNGNNQDSTSNNFNNYIKENVLIHPLDSIKKGTKYLRQENKYAYTKQNTVWSFYVQPMFKFGSDGDNEIFFHLHFELLANNWTTTTKITNVQQDTAVISNPKGFYARPNIGNNLVYKTTLLNGYFGGGLTFNLKISETSRLFFQPTIGFTTNTPDFASVDVNSNVLTVSSDGLSAFYLVRANYQQVASGKLTLVLGTDIRGLFPKYPPQYAIYIGGKLDLSALTDLIK